MKFIDRSLPEILKLNISSEKEKVIEFASLLYKFGITVLEIDKACIKYISNFPKNMEYFFRVEREEDLEFIKLKKIKGAIISIKDYSYERQFNLISNLIKLKKKIILEVAADNLEAVENYFDFPEGNLLFHGDVLRITGLASCVTEELRSFIERTKKKYYIEIDMCAENDYFCATGVAVNAVMDGVDYVTGTFSGFGGEAGFSALEEVIMAAVIIKGIKSDGDTDILPEIKLLIEELTGTVMCKDKPIIGNDIFLCMSGIHVDGIIKNPKNYEPFEPELVGLKRRIVLGKHSGRSAVEWILDQCNIDYNNEDLPRILQVIQEKSIEFKRYFDGEDLKKIISELRAC